MLASVRGRIYDIEHDHNLDLFMVGSFDTAYINNTITGNIDTLNTSNFLINTYNNQWNSLETNVSDTIFCAELVGQSMYFGGGCAPGEICLSSYLNNSVQSHVLNNSYDSVHHKISDIIYQGNNLYLAGKFRVFNLMSYGSYLATYNPTTNDLQPLASLNNEVNTIAFYKNERIIAGKFTADFYNDANYIAKLDTYEEDDPPTNISKEMTNLEVKPNPFKNFIFVNKNLIGYQYDLVNLKGQKVKFGKLTSNKIDNIEFLNKGIYILKIYNDKNSFVAKVLKE